MELVFLHGFCENKKIWTEFTKCLPDQFRFHTPDLLGFGTNQSRELQDISIKDMAKDINVQLQQSNVTKPVLIGHSLGGYVALEMIKRKPDNYSALVMFHSTAFPDSKEKRINRNKTIEFVIKHGTDQFSQNFCDALFYNPDHEYVVQLKKMVKETPLNTFTEVTKAMRDRPSSEQLIRHINIPTLYILGENDPFVAKNREISAISHNSSISFDIISQCAHIGMIENKNACIECLVGFLKKIPNFFVD